MALQQTSNPSEVAKTVMQYPNPKLGLFTPTTLRAVATGPSHPKARRECFATQDDHFDMDAPQHSSFLSAWLRTAAALTCF